MSRIPKKQKLNNERVVVLNEVQMYIGKCQERVKQKKLDEKMYVQTLQSMIESHLKSHDLQVTNLLLTEMLRCYQEKICQLEQEGVLLLQLALPDLQLPVLATPLTEMDSSAKVWSISPRLNPLPEKSQ